MKTTTILTIAASAIVSGSFLTSCNSEAQKIDNEEISLNVAQQSFSQVQDDYTIEVKKHREEADKKIAANKKRIVELKEDMSKEKNDVNADYKKKIADLEQKNDDLKKKMDNYKPDSKGKWESFKTEFDDDMDELGRSLKDFSVKNTK